MKIAQYTKEGKFIRFWKSEQEIIDFYGIIWARDVRRALKGEIKICHWSQWRITNSKKDIKPFNRHKIVAKMHRRKVHQLDPHTMKIIRTWDSVSDAVKATGAKQPNISNAASGRNDFIIAGYRWKFAEPMPKTLKKRELWRKKRKR